MTSTGGNTSQVCEAQLEKSRNHGMRPGDGVENWVETEVEDSLVLGGEVRERARVLLDALP